VNKKEEQEEDEEKKKGSTRIRKLRIYIYMSLVDKRNKQRFVWDNDRCGVVQTSFLQIIFI
jgi:hypothetical protein